MCYYGVSDNETASMDNNQTCRADETLCVRVVNDEQGYEFRSCWNGGDNEEFTSPGCYVGFPHCHLTPEGEHCYNDTTICVCADSLCNTEKYTSPSPPVTPGSGLACYAEEHWRR